MSTRRGFTPLEAKCPVACRGNECRPVSINAGCNACLRRQAPRELLTGFTLMETLVAFASGALVLAALLTIFTIGRTALEREIQRAELVQNARVSFERITRDLRQAQGYVTALPETDAVPEFPPPSEFEFLDGHEPELLNYLRYHLDGTALLRELSYYSFPAAPAVRVLATDRDASGNPPDKTTLEDTLIAEGFTDLEFFGERLLSVRSTLQMNATTVAFETNVFARNVAGSGD